MNKFWLSGKITFMRQLDKTNSFVFGIAADGYSEKPQYMSVFIKQDAKNVNFALAEAGAHACFIGYISTTTKDNVTTTYLNAYDAAFIPTASAGVHLETTPTKPTTTQTATQPAQRSKWSEKKQPVDDNADDDIAKYFDS